MATMDTKDDVRAVFDEKMPGLLAAMVAALRAELSGELLTLPQAAKLAGTTTAALRKKCERGSVRCVRVGRSIRLRRGDVGGAE